MEYGMKVDLILLAVFGGIPALYALYFWHKKEKEHIPNILKAEQKRKAHPDIQTGKFTHLYTMPYDEDVNAQTLRAYIESQYPKYLCTISEDTLMIKDNATGEERNLIFTQLRSDDVTAIELVDPYEVVNEGRRKSSNYVTRTSLYDLGFSSSIRKAILHFQEQAVAKRER